MLDSYCGGRMKNIILGITGGIAAYKALHLLSLLRAQQYDVKVVMTPNATKIIPPKTLEILSGHCVYTDEWDTITPGTIQHIELATWTDAVLVAPATYNTIGTVAHGLANTMLTCIIAACNKPIFFALAMNSVMYHNPILQNNLQYLRELGYIIIEPDEGLLVCGVYGKGRLRKEEDIVAILQDVLSNTQQIQQLKGKKILITAGRTEELIDPVRYISNASSGTMGFALARACVAMGAEVTLVVGKYTATLPDVHHCIFVRTTQEMCDAVTDIYSLQDIVIACAAVTDYTVQQYSKKKIKKHNESILLELKPTVDILDLLGKHKTNQYLVGFALETENILENAKKKLLKKNLNMIVANTADVIGQTEGSIYICSHNRPVDYIENKHKNVLAYAILDAIIHDSSL